MRSNPTYLKENFFNLNFLKFFYFSIQLIKSLYRALKNSFRIESAALSESFCILVQNFSKFVMNLVTNNEFSQVLQSLYAQMSNITYKNIRSIHNTFLKNSQTFKFFLTHIQHNIFHLTKKSVRHKKYFIFFFFMLLYHLTKNCLKHRKKRMIKNNYDDDELTYVSVIKNLCSVEPQKVIIF